VLICEFKREFFHSKYYNLSIINKRQEKKEFIH